MRQVTTFILSLAFCIPSVATIASPVKAEETSAKYAEIKNERILTVTGRGDRLVKTVKARIQLGVNVEGKTAIAVQTEVARQANSIVSTLQQLNVEKLQTLSVQLNPKYVYENNRQRQDGFTGQTSVSFVVPLERAGEVLDAAVNSGANQVEQISFIANDADLYAAKQLALQDALKDAQAQSNTVLSTLGFSQKTIKSIQIIDSGVSYPINQPRFDSYAKAASVVPILGGDQKIEASVTLQITY
ncbi:SIMPL domain-containing protein [Pseudanabaena sp. 'Roaring Creek']|uniref:SIMPL domain-containing protein n=1 Tax=Pseudanabaena sp. 'Roaring Creek' TaxID=1681830 RepID=UPI0006D80763|nr:SIMPL domain-containing protein [Pseudanabaena sp. 'Roaring Creek']